MNKNILKNKKFIISIIFILVILATHIYSQKDVVTVPTGSMREARVGHQAILMNDGRVFVIHEEEGLNPDSAEIYDPKMGKFKYIGKMNEKVTHSDILLPNNQILLVGILNYTKNPRNPSIANSEIYDPVSNTFITIDHLHYPKTSSVLATLPNKMVLIAGFTDAVPIDLEKTLPKCDKNFTKSNKCNTDYFRAELYNPRTRKFSFSDVMTHPIEGNFVQLNDGNLLIYGMAYYKPISEAAVYDYKINKFIQTRNNSKSKGFFNAILLKNGKVLFIGATGQTPKPIAEIFNPKTNNFFQVKNMNIPRLDPKMVLLKNGKVLILGGRALGMEHVDQAEIFDPDTETFTLTGKMNTIRTPNEFRGGYTTTLLPSGKVLIVGGEIGEGLSEIIINDIEIYDPQTGIFTRKKMRAARIEPITILLRDGRVLIAGGGTNWVDGLRSAEIYKDK